MKLVFCLMAFVLAYVLACDPDGDNEPICTRNNLNQPIRNFWDPTRYWLCTAVGHKAESVRCDDGEGFYVVKNRCVSWEQWSWTPYCLQVRTQK